MYDCFISIFTCFDLSFINNLNIVDVIRRILKGELGSTQDDITNNLLRENSPIFSLANQTIIIDIDNFKSD
jgi:hypothetical protein